MGHEVTVFAGQPWPVVDEDEGVRFVKVPSLDLYREPDPFRFPKPSEFRSLVDLLELATMMTGGFPEPLTFTLRVRVLLARRRGQFDIVHDNQSFGRGLLGLMADGWPVIGTCHHPVTVDRLVDVALRPHPLAGTVAAPVVRVRGHAEPGGPQFAPHHHRFFLVSARHRRADGGGA